MDSIGRFANFANGTIESGSTHLLIGLEIDRPWQAPSAAEQRAEAEAAAAKQRALILLTEHLNVAQREEFAQRQGFTVTGSTGKRYWIELGTTYNVYHDVPGVCFKFCAALGHGFLDTLMIPVYDHMLAQKLLIEADAMAFEDAANVTAREEAYWGVARDVCYAPHDER